MTKKFTLMMFFLLLLGAASFSQTASLATITASPGENKAVALNVTGFTGIGSITFNIRFKPSVMTFTGVSNPSMGVSFLTGVTDSTINIVWTGFPYVSFPDGKLLDMNFTYYGMTTSPLNFLGSCEVTQGVTQIFPTYTNGSVSMAVVPQTATLVGTTASTGGPAPVVIKYASMPGGIGAITQKVHYDPTKLNIVSVTGVGTLASGTNYSADISTGIITITWTNIGGTNINWPSNEFILDFIYIGSTVTNVDFLGGSIISTASPVTNVPVTYYGGIVSLAAPTATAVLGSVTGALQGQDYEVPLTLAGFPSGVAGGTQAFTLTIPYDSPRLSYLGIKSPVPPGLVVSQASGTLTLAWTNAAGPNINGNFLTLKFKYNGIGTAHVNFGNACVFNTYNAGVVGTVQVAYTNATIAPAIVTPNATIAFIPGTVGSNVLVPVSFDGLPTNMGAVTLYITYDFDKLTFIDAQNNIHGANVNLNIPTHTIQIAWNAGSATDINGKFLDLRFTYNGGSGSGCAAAVNFTDGCELANFAAVIVPTNWINGGVNFAFRLSGILTYDIPSSVVLDGATIYVKSGPEPVPPAVGPIPATIYTTTTDGSGYFEVWVPNGTYYLYASTTKTWEGVDLGDVTQIRRYIGLMTNTVNSPLRLRSADVSMDGNIDGTDVTALRRRLGLMSPNPNFAAPDWIFQNPIVLINCADLPNQNFTGVSTGDVNGTFPF